MLYEVLNTLETESTDGSTGINARITTVNSEESLTGPNAVPSLQTIHIWGASDGLEAKLPAEFAEGDLPALVLKVVESDGALQSQGKRRANHVVEFYYLDHEPDQRRARQFMALMQKALVRWVEGILGTGTIANAEDIKFSPRRWLTAGRNMDIERAVLSCRLVERDENP